MVFMDAIHKLKLMENQIVIIDFDMVPNLTKNKKGIEQIWDCIPDYDEKKDHWYGYQYSECVILKKGTIAAMLGYEPEFEEYPILLTVDKISKNASI